VRTEAVPGYLQYCQQIDWHQPVGRYECLIATDLAVTGISQLRQYLAVYPCGVYPVALLTYTIQTYNIKYIYVDTFSPEDGP
jgi:hypothetical protein